MSRASAACPPGSASLREVVTEADRPTVALEAGGRPIALKWHCLRRSRTDPAFSRANLRAGLAAGAVVEVDLAATADGDLVCLHDLMLDRETTGRGRPYAPPLAAFALSIVASLGGVAVHFLLGQPVSAREALVTLVPSALLAALLILPLHRLCGALIGPVQRYEPAHRVELV